MHKSSSMTFVYKYLFTPTWGGGFLLVIFSTWNTNDSFSQDWSIGAILMLSWILPWLIIMMIRLRSVEASQDNLVIKTFNGPKTIAYKDIEWVFQIALINPTMISLKYHEKETGEFSKILIMPSMSSQLFKFNTLRELEMTKFIREQVMTAKPNYSKDLEPSRWLPLGILLITGIPIIVIVNLYFMNFQ